MRIAHESDRAALRSWFLLLAEAQFLRPTPDVADCAGLIRHALREALRPHSLEWLHRMNLPFPQRAPELTDRPRVAGPELPLFLVGRVPPTYAEFADARTIIALNAEAIGRDVRAARPGDLLYFRADASHQADHLMIFLGTSIVGDAGRDWLVYHTGPDDAGRGEMRKVPMGTMLKHPAARWRPAVSNPAFAGVYRLNLLQ